MEADMTDDRIEGGVRKGIGRVQDAFGGLTGDARTQMKGKLNEAAGAAQDAAGQVRDLTQGLLEDVEGYARENPRAALAITLGLGVALGLMLFGGGRTVYRRR
jgi:uncharacterized protein YjbJ (UPF0337 family)